MIRVRNPQEIKEERAGTFVKMSMSTYSANIPSIPLILKIDYSDFFYESIPCFSDKAVLCRHCGASFNPYCSILEESENWKCSICSSVNRLPLPLSISGESAYTLAYKSILYNNAVFDVIDSINDKVEKPIIVVAIHSSLINDIKNVINNINVEENLFFYSLIVFDNFVQLFDFKTKSWKVLVDEDYFLPTLLENLIGDWESTKEAIKSIRISSSCFCNISNLLSFTKQLKNSKLFILLKTLPNNLLVNFEVTCSIAFIGKNHKSIFQYKLYDKCNLFYSESFDQKMLNFIHNELSYPFMFDPKIIMHTSKNISLDSLGFNIYSFLPYNPNLSIIEYLQIEIMFSTINGFKVRRYINFKIPITHHKLIYQSISFSNPLLNLYSISSFLIYKCFIASLKGPNNIKNIISNISSIYPMEKYWPNFIQSVTSSPVFNENCEQIQSTLFYLLKLPVHLLILYFLSIDYVDGKIISSYPKPNELSKGRATFNGIYILDYSILPDFLSLLRIKSNILPIYKVSELPNVSISSDI